MVIENIIGVEVVGMFVVDDINGMESITDVAVATVVVVKLVMAGIVLNVELVDTGVTVTLVVLVTGVIDCDVLVTVDVSEVIVDDILTVELAVDMKGILDMVDGDMVVLSEGSTLTHSLTSSINNITLLLSNIITLNTNWALVLLALADSDTCTLLLMLVKLLSS